MNKRQRNKRDKQERERLDIWIKHMPTWLDLTMRKIETMIKENPREALKILQSSLRVRGSNSVILFYMGKCHNEINRQVNRP